MRRAIMIDVDGVLITHPERDGWIAHLERDLGLSPTALQQAFFEPHWDDVVHGRATLRDRLAPALARIAPAMRCDDLIGYWFDNDAHLDHALLTELATLRADGVEVHLATVQEHERASYLWDRLALRSRFDGIHYAAALGCSKPAAAFYRAIEQRTRFSPEAIFFIDDKAANVAGARRRGWTAALWTGEQTVRALAAAARWPLPDCRA